MVSRAERACRVYVGFIRFIGFRGFTRCIGFRVCRVHRIWRGT